MKLTSLQLNESDRSFSTVENVKDDNGVLTEQKEGTLGSTKMATMAKETPLVLWQTEMMTDRQNLQKDVGWFLAIESCNL